MYSCAIEIGKWLVEDRETAVSIAWKIGGCLSRSRRSTIQLGPLKKRMIVQRRVRCVQLCIDNAVRHA